MCTDELTSSLAVIKKAHQFASELLGEPLVKAMNLDTPRGFDRAVAALAAELSQQTKGSDRDAMRAAVEILDIDWRSSTASQRRRLISEAMSAAGRATALIPAKIQSTLGPAADELVSATRSHGRRVHGLAIAADFNAIDRRITAHVIRSQLNFVTDELGRRLDDFGVEARRIVEEGLEMGLGRDDISQSLHKAAQGTFIARSSLYWEVVAGAFIGNGRSFAQLSSYAEAGIRRYLIEAVLDEQTTEICRYLHGKVFEVGAALRRFEALEGLKKPEELKAAQPWVREALDPNTGNPILFIKRGGKRIPLVEVTRSGFGSADDQGEHRQAVSNQALMDLGVGFPPYHGLCRTNVTPLIT